MKFFAKTMIFLFLSGDILLSNPALSPEDLMRTQEVREVSLSPDGQWIAYTVQVPREISDKPGAAYRELHLLSVQTGENRPYIIGKVTVTSPQWHPEGHSISFLAKRNDDKYRQVWSISFQGGEAQRLTNALSTVKFFRWHPEGIKIGYLAETPEDRRESLLKQKGFDFIFHNEGIKHVNLYIHDLRKENAGAERITEGMTLWDFEFSPDGRSVAASISPENLIDHKYMYRKIHLIDLADGNIRLLTNNEGKLGNYRFNPGGTMLVYTAALNLNDSQVSQVFIQSLDAGQNKNLTPVDFKGHVTWAGWLDDHTIVYRSGEGVWSVYSRVNVAGGDRELMLHSGETGIIYEEPAFSTDRQHLAVIGRSPEIPGDVYYGGLSDPPVRFTEVNPWLNKRQLGEQEIITYTARDGLEIEGVLMYPVDFISGTRYPLIVYVHGGPEHHHYNEWLTRYSEPGQVMAGKGYLVFYPNYRASTGYGVPFSMEGFEDPAGKEFDDVADGIDYLVESGLADPERVGLAGGSYGGYAAAWFATYYTDYVRAVCMFVGVSNLISKRGTTDIPYEELYVHSGSKLEEMWDFSLKRSPIYWAHQSKTAVLIYGGTEDTRVHPAQSLEFYTRLKMNDHPTVRLVQYPGEKHGNSKQAARLDVLLRQIQWLDWYVMEKNDIDGPMPPLDISDQYGIDLQQN